MKYKIGDKVIFKAQPDKVYAWKLDNYKEYIIVNKAFSDENSTDYKPNTTYYGVSDRKGTETTWFEAEDFITIKDHRKLKLKKINKNHGN